MYSRLQPSLTSNVEICHYMRDVDFVFACIAYMCVHYTRSCCNSNLNYLFSIRLQTTLIGSFPRSI